MVRFHFSFSTPRFWCKLPLLSRSIFCIFFHRWLYQNEKKHMSAKYVAVGMKLKYFFGKDVLNLASFWAKNLKWHICVTEQAILFWISTKTICKKSPVTIQPNHLPSAIYHHLPRHVLKARLCPHHHWELLRYHDCSFQRSQRKRCQPMHG